MRRYYFPILFCIGFLSVVFAGLFSPAKNLENKNNDTSRNYIEASTRNRYGEVLVSSNITQEYLNQARNTILDINSKTQRTDTFEFLRSERIEEDPTFEIAVMPELKSLVLDGMIKRFTRSDWLFWKESLFPLNASNQNFKFNDEFIQLKERTAARSFVDQVKVKNILLGKYLETAALLFSGLYLATDQGRVFSVEEELYSLSSSAHIIFRTRTAKGVSPRSNLDIEITEDPPFIFWLESLRASFVVLYCQREKKQLETQFELLSSVHNMHFNKSITDTYSNLYLTSANLISPRFREEIRVKFSDPNRERELSQLSVRYKNSFLSFNESLFNDAINKSDVSKAKGIVLSLSAVFPEEQIISAFEERIEILKNEINNKSSAEKIQVTKDISNSSSSYGGILSDSVFKSKLPFEKLNLTKVIEKSGFAIMILLLILILVYKIIPKFSLILPDILSILNLSRFKGNKQINIIETEEEMASDINILQGSSTSQDGIATAGGQVRSIKEGIQLREKKRAIG